MSNDKNNKKVDHTRARDKDISIQKNTANSAMEKAKNRPQ